MPLNLKLKNSIREYNTELFLDTLSDLQINILLEEEKNLREKHGIHKMLDKTYEILEEKSKNPTKRKVILISEPVYDILNI